jgi:diketogulonate reductase-like aldo/keto reductase
MESLKEAVEEGLTTAVGVSNYSRYQVSIYALDVTFWQILDEINP